MKFSCFLHTFSTLQTHWPTPTRHNRWDAEDERTILGWLINLHGVRIDVNNVPKLTFPMQTCTAPNGVKRSETDRLTMPFTKN